MCRRADDLADTVHPRDPDRPKLPLGLVELFCDASVPSRRKPNVLMTQTTHSVLPVRGQCSAHRRCSDSS